MLKLINFRKRFMLNKYRTARPLKPKTSRHLPNLEPRHKQPRSRLKPKDTVSSKNFLQIMRLILSSKKLKQDFKLLKASQKLWR